MRSFEYGDEEISPKMLGYAVVSMAIAIGILIMPRIITNTTELFDGSFAVLIGGSISLVLGYFSAKLASKFPKQPFYTYAQKIATKPVAIALTLLMALFFLSITSFELRSLSNIASKYLFDVTPPQVVSLVFFLAVIYAVSGSDVAVLRLNLMFLPIFLTVLLMLFVFNIRYLDVTHFTPFFTTSWYGMLQASLNVAKGMYSFSVVLFYISFMNKPKKAVKATMIGVSLTLLINFTIFFFVVGQLGHAVTQNVMYPTIEMAKETEVPGEFFARFDSLFFTVWIMAIFNTTTMAFHIAILAINSLFKKAKKFTLILIHAPIIYFVSMLVGDSIQLGVLSSWMFNYGLILLGVTPITLLVIAKFRKVKGDA